MKINEMKLNEIHPYENNPRLNDEAVEYVAKSIKEFGFRVPIIIDKDNVIVAGHTRYKASQQLGLDTVPCIKADDLTPEQVKAFRIADNKTGEKASWDLNKLKLELQDIDLDFDMTDFGFGDFELSMLTEEDLEPDGYDQDLIDKYSENSDEFLVNKRVILTYKSDEEENFLRNLLKFDEEELKVVLPVKDLMERYEK